jgi:SAM-dependent methyltransferase
VEHRDAIALIRGAVEGRSGAWADLGAGTGTFTRALAELLGPHSTIYAVDKDRAAYDELKSIARELKNVVPVHADFTQQFETSELRTRLDGMLFANALHFVKDNGEVLGRLASALRPGGRIVIVEYDRREASRWVPYPIPRTRLPSLAARAGLPTPRIVASRPSDYQGELYVAIADVSEKGKGERGNGKGSTTTAVKGEGNG